MKKLFALFMVVAILAVAGTAMAADPAKPTLTASPTAAVVVAGRSATVDLSAAAANSGRLSSIAITGPSWATLSGRTLTLAPGASVTTGSYTVTASVTETIGSDTNSHGTSVPVTVSTTLPIAVNVVAPTTTGSTIVITRVVEKVVTITRSVTVIAAAVQESAVVETFEQTTRTVTAAITSITATGANSVKGFTEALVTIWANATKAAAIETAKTAVVTAVVNSPARREQVFPGLPATAVVTAQTNDKLKPATSSVASTATPAQKLAAATEALGGAGKALSATEAVQPTESGTYTFPKTFGSDLYGTKIKGNRGGKGAPKRTAFTISAADTEGVAFVNSSGDVVDTIPDDSRSADIMPGFVNMLVVMEAGEVYEPVIFSTTEDLAAAGVSVDTEPTTVDVNEVEYKEEEVLVSINETGEAEGEVVIANPDTDPEAKAVQTAIQAAFPGAQSLTVTFLMENSDPVSDDVITTDDTAAKSANLHVSARYGRAIRNLPTGTYYLPITLTKASGTVATGASFMLYPDGVTGGSPVKASVRNASGDEAATSYEGDGYFVFAIDSDSKIKAANDDNTLTNPTIALELQESSNGGTTIDPAITALIPRFVDATGKTLLDAAFAGGTKPTFGAVGSDGKYTLAVKLNFDVAEWRVNVANNGSITQSAFGDLSKVVANDANSATITLVKSEITKGDHTVTLDVRPSGAATGNFVSTTLGTIAGNPDLAGVGSASGGCSAGFAGLAMAVLGAFIVTRKK